MYNEHPTWLRFAHKASDKVALTAYMAIQSERILTELYDQLPYSRYRYGWIPPPSPVDEWNGVANPTPQRA